MERLFKSLRSSRSGFSVTLTGIGLLFGYFRWKCLNIKIQNSILINCKNKFIIIYILILFYYNTQKSIKVLFKDSLSYSVHDEANTI